MNVYPFQVPAQSAILATRGKSPYCNFRVITSEVEDGAAAEKGQLGQGAVPARPVDPGAVRPAGVAAEQPDVKQLLDR